MKVMSKNSERVEVVLTQQELLIVSAALNEICNGIDVFEFQTRIGVEREHVLMLLKEVGVLLDTLD